MGQPILQVDAFTNTPFAGNPAAVCVLEQERDDRWMQNVAMEMNLSETAFLVRQADGFNLRWFTPMVEVDLCGHATLASAHVLWSEGHLSPDAEARFHTRSGLLTAQRRADWIELNFPAIPMVEAEAPPELMEAIGLPFRAVRRNASDYLVEVDSADAVKQLQPNLALLKSLSVNGAIVTSAGSPSGASASYDFVSRYFAPGIGIDEDPVTGYAHCCLATYWRDRLTKTEFLAYQASARGGVVKVRCEGDRVVLAGQAVTVLRGELMEG